jgi:hypothetical protein
MKGQPPRTWRPSPTWQRLYHFTVGGQVEDARLATLPAHGPGAGS